MVKGTLVLVFFSTIKNSLIPVNTTWGPKDKDVRKRKEKKNKAMGGILFLKRPDSTKTEGRERERERKRSTSVAGVTWGADGHSATSGQLSLQDRRPSASLAGWAGVLVAAIVRYNTDVLGGKVK